MLQRNDVYHIIDVERDYQDATYNPHEVLESGLTRMQRDLDITPTLTLLASYIRMADDAWTNSKKVQNASGGTSNATQMLAKIAAIAVRGLERVGGSEKLLTTGLR